MLNLIEDKVSEMNITVKQLFHSMTDEDFLVLHESGQLKAFCDALSLDLNNKSDEKNNTYTA